MQSAQVKMQAHVSPSDTFLDYVCVEGCHQPLANVKMTTLDGEVWAHSALLVARSMYFATLLGGQMQASHELPQIPVRTRTVVAVLRYLYTDVINFATEDVESLRELFFVAKKWKLFVLEALFGKSMASADVPVLARFPSLWDDLGKLHQQSNPADASADVILEVQEQHFPAHRIVLVAQSDFFRSLFTMGWRESASSVPTPGGDKKKQLNVISIGNISAFDFRAVLHFAYTHRIPRSHEKLDDLMRLYPAASYFAFPALADGISSLVAKAVDLSYSNCATVWNLAKANSFEGLEGKCCEFVLLRFESYPAHAFFGLPRELLQRVLEPGELDVDEDVVIQRLISWGYAQLGRQQPRDPSRIRIPHDSELMDALASLLPPNALMTRRNRMALLGLNPFAMSELM